MQGRDIFFGFSNAFSVRKGDLLISEPCMKDSNFERTVVLICNNPEGEEGHFGFILNKPYEDIKLDDIVDEEISGNHEVFFGGPVDQDILHFIHARPDIIPDGIEVSNGWYLGGDFELIKQLLKNNALNGQEIRFFVGYSGWTFGQIEEELAHNAWIVSNMDITHAILLPTELMWKDVLHHMGGKYKMYSNYPYDPRLN